MDQKKNSLLHPCPTCKKSLAWDKNNKFRPFCCERCRLIDLGAWADGTYAIESDEVPPDDDQFD